MPDRGGLAGRCQVINTNLSTLLLLMAQREHKHDALRLQELKEEVVRRQRTVLRAPADSLEATMSIAERQSRLRWVPRPQAGLCILSKGPPLHLSYLKGRRPVQCPYMGTLP